MVRTKGNTTKHQMVILNREGEEGEIPAQERAINLDDEDSAAGNGPIPLNPNPLEPPGEEEAGIRFVNMVPATKNKGTER